MNNTTFSAAPSATGYLFQCRYALFESLKKTRKGITFTTSIEALDDVTFQSDGSPPELLQTKHHQRRSSDLTDAAVDLWKSIRIWSEGIKSKSIPDGATFFLITTSTAGDGSIATYLRGDNSRNVGSAIERLNSVAGSSTNRTNEAAYLSFRSLTPEEKNRLFQSVFVVDSVPVMADLDSAIKEEIFHAVEFKFLDSFVTRLEGWWLRRVIKHLIDPRTGPILSEELLTEIANLRE